MDGVVKVFSVKELKTAPTRSKWSIKCKNSFFSDFFCHCVCRQTTQLMADSFGDGDKRNANSRGPYTILTPSQKFEIGKRAAEVGSTAAMRYYAKSYPALELKETSVRRFKNNYQTQLKTSAKEVSDNRN